jgi:hypothetical protein
MGSPNRSSRLCSDDLLGYHTASFEIQIGDRRYQALVTFEVEVPHGMGEASTSLAARAYLGSIGTEPDTPVTEIRKRSHRLHDPCSNVGYHSVAVQTREIPIQEFRRTSDVYEVGCPSGLSVWARSNDQSVKSLGHGRLEHLQIALG